VPEQVHPAGHGWRTRTAFSPGDIAAVGFVGLRPTDVRRSALPAATSLGHPRAGEVSGVVWLDFTRGGGGSRGVIDPGEVGLSGIRVQAVDAGGGTVGSATTARDGSFHLAVPAGGTYRLRLAERAFRPPFRGVAWLGPSLITPAIIAAYVWIWAGFALVVIRAGLSALPDEVLEAARVDGASGGQAFRHVTLPLLAPVLVVVLTTLVLNVLKVFDLVLVLAPGSVQADANVLALEMWRVAFGAQPDRGLGSALAVVLFLLVVPVMVLNLRRLRSRGAAA
jgi:alpha-glucoside transport system permease protein